MRDELSEQPQEALQRRDARREYLCRPPPPPLTPDPPPSPPPVYLVVGVLDIGVHLRVLRGGDEPLEGVVEHLLEDHLLDHVEHVRGDDGLVCQPGVYDALYRRSLFRRDAPHLRER